MSENVNSSGIGTPQNEGLGVHVISSGAGNDYGVTATRLQELSSESLSNHSHQNGEQVFANGHSPIHEGSKPERKCFQCCPTSIYSFFNGLGKVVTGYNLTLELPNLGRYIKKESSNQVDVPNIPFETLDEESPPPQETNVANPSEALPHATSSSSSIIRVKFNFPCFIIFVSISQWAVFHFIMKDEYDGWMSSNLEFNPLKRYELWRFVTAAWIHGTVTHLRGNLWIQLITGCCLEVVHGWKRVSIVYFGGVVFGNLATSVVEPFLRAYGASGGVYALITGHIASNILNWNESCGAFNRCFCLCIYLCLAILAAFNTSVAQHVLPAHHLIGHAAHLGAALSGFLIGCFVLKNFRKTPWEIKLSKICRNITIVLFILAVGGNIADQIFFWKSLEIAKQKKLLALTHQNHATTDNHFYNTTNVRMSAY